MLDKYLDKNSTSSKIMKTIIKSETEKLEKIISNSLSIISMISLMYSLYYVVSIKDVRFVLSILIWGYMLYISIRTTLLENYKLTIEDNCMSIQRQFPFILLPPKTIEYSDIRNIVYITTRERRRTLYVLELETLDGNSFISFNQINSKDRGVIKRKLKQETGLSIEDKKGRWLFNPFGLR